MCRTNDILPKRNLCNFLRARLSDFRDLAEDEVLSPSVESKAKKVHRLLPLLDELISAYRTADGEEIPPIDLAPEISLCDFCGGELFFAVFRCTAACGQDEITGDIGHQILLCVFCYMDGRTCDCKVMDPYLLALDSDLLDLRNDLASLLRRFLQRGVVFENDLVETM